MNYNEIENQICEFDLYLKQTMDLLKDAYRWKIMADECENQDMVVKYKQVSNTLFDMFMKEHDAIGQIFKGQ